MRRRRRPRGWWFLAPVVLMAAGVAAIVLAFVSVLGPLTQYDAIVTADSSPQVVELDDDGPRLLMGPELGEEPRCEARDPEGGEPLPLETPSASYSATDGSGAWRGFAVVEPLSDSVELTCSGGTEVRVGPLPGAGMFGSFAALLVAGIGLGSIGFVALVVLVVLFATGAPRKP